MQEHHSDLRKWINVQELIPLLRKQELLTAEEWEEISGKQTRLQKIDQLIQILPQKGELSYLKFIDCLESEDEHPAHKELAVKLKKTQSAWQQRILSTTDSDVTKAALKVYSSYYRYYNIIYALTSTTINYIKALQNRINYVL